MPYKIDCTCGCGNRVSAHTERKHLELAALTDLPTSILQANSNKCQTSKSAFGDSRLLKQKRQAPQELPATTGRPRKRQNLSTYGVQATAPGNANDLGDTEHSAPPPSPVVGHSQPATRADTSSTTGNQASERGLFSAEDARELSFLRRSARIEARLQAFAQQYHLPLQELTRDDVEEHENNDSEDDEEDVVGGEFGEDDLSGEGFEDYWNKAVEPAEDWTLPASAGEEGLSVWDLLEQDFLKEVSEMDGTILDKGDLKLLQAYLLKMEDGLSDETFLKLKVLLPEADITSLKSTETRVQNLSGFKPVRYDCCPNSCICYTGSHETRDECPYCKTPRYKSETDKTPRSYFEYLPITPRLRAMVANRDFAEKMTYRSKHVPTSDTITDVFDGSNYRELLATPVTVGNQTMPFCHFSDCRDIALGLSTDGFGPFKRRTKTAWPLVLFNYNLPPAERFAKQNLISAGVIPGPKKPIDMDSFLWPLVCEFIQLSIGVKAFDALAKAMFLLRAYLILVFGDIPAVSLVMRMKGQNGRSPCRMCEIQGIRTPNAAANAPLYVPLNRENFPDSPPSYDPRNLPHRTHQTFLTQAREVQEAPTKDESEELATRYGIKGVPLLSSLSSLSFPRSFPYDFMHLIWCNLIKNLIKLWTGTFKNLDHQTEDYYLKKELWNTIGKETADAGAYIPSAFGSRVPDLAAERSHLISETYSNWTLQMSPAILRNRFLHERIYKHHLRLVKLLRLCLDYEFNSDQIHELEEGFSEWVEDYERFYYKHDPSRASCCPLTLHALLHIASGIRQAGPVWAYWAFPMERHCGDIGRHVKSRRFPYTSINRYVTSKAHITQIKLLYNLRDQLSLTSPPSCKDHFTSPRYKYFVLSPPVRAQQTLSHALWLKLTASFATRFTVGANVMRKAFPATTPVTFYGRVERIDGGDTMQARELVGETSDSRDMSYIRYRLSVDKHAHIRRRQPEFEWREHYGQLLRVIVIDLQQASPPNPKIKPGIYIYAIVRNQDVVSESVGPMKLNYFIAGDEGRIEVIDLNRIKCVIGRIKRGDRWAIVDRQEGSGLFPVHRRHG